MKLTMPEIHEKLRYNSRVLRLLHGHSDVRMLRPNTQPKFVVFWFKGRWECYALSSLCGTVKGELEILDAQQRALRQSLKTSIKRMSPKKIGSKYLAHKHGLIGMDSSTLHALLRRNKATVRGILRSLDALKREYLEVRRNAIGMHSAYVRAICRNLAASMGVYREALKNLGEQQRGAKLELKSVQRKGGIDEQLEKV